MRNNTYLAMSRARRKSILIKNASLLVLFALLERVNVKELQWFVLKENLTPVYGQWSRHLLVAPLVGGPQNPATCYSTEGPSWILIGSSTYRSCG
jgi:hypothetical protein